MSSLADFLLAHAQPGYERGVAAIARRWGSLFGSDTFDGKDLDAIAATVLSRLETTLSPGHVATAASDISALIWWCGLPFDRERHVRLGRAVRAASGRLLGAIKLDEAMLTAPPRRAAFYTGALQSPHHSPSRGAADYIAALLDDPDVEQIDVYHGGVLSDAMKAYLRERLGGAADRVALIPTDAEQHFASMIERGPYVHHIWCDYAARVHLALASRLGPTVMYACGDQPPMQHADVYWFYHRPDYVAGRWAEEGAPEGFAARYVETVAGPHNPALTAVERGARATWGLPEDAVVIATVGNRLSVDFDQAFVDGVGGLVASDPRFVWLVVGALPEWLSSACGQVLGDRFRHIGFERELGKLLGAVDLFANPFRRGGGDTAVTAMLGGAVVVTTEAGDVGGLVPQQHRATGSEDYIERLTALAGDPALRAAWAAEQAVHIGGLTDQARFGAELRRLTTLAFERYQARAGVNPWSMDDEKAAGDRAAA